VVWNLRCESVGERKREDEGCESCGSSYVERRGAVGREVRVSIPKDKERMGGGMEKKKKSITL